jgi:hypothetical protein
MRIVVDTNVLVSATYWKGDSYKVIRIANERQMTIMMSREITEEYYKVIKSDEVTEKVEKKNLMAEKIITKVINESVVVEPKDKLFVIKEDPDDDKFLECAVEGDAEYLVSRDKHLLKLKKYKGIDIIKPEEFLRIINACKPRNNR